MEKLVEEMKQWCVDNYENGADTMVECWDTEDYLELIQEAGAEGAWDILKRVAGVYRERQADARFYRENF